jgi:hypothetical protein
MDAEALVLFSFVWAQTQAFHLAKEWHRWASAPDVVRAIGEDARTPRLWLAFAVAGAAAVVFAAQPPSTPHCTVPAINQR